MPVFCQLEQLSPLKQSYVETSGASEGSGTSGETGSGIGSLGWGLSGPDGS